MVLGKDIARNMHFYVLLKTVTKALDNKMSTGAVFIDLSNAFDCLNHDLLIAKLEAYGLSKSASNKTYI